MRDCRDIREILRVSHLTSCDIHADVAFWGRGIRANLAFCENLVARLRRKVQHPRYPGDIRAQSRDIRDIRGKCRDIRANQPGNGVRQAMVSRTSPGHDSDDIELSSRQPRHREEGL